MRNAQKVGVAEKGDKDGQSKRQSEDQENSARQAD
jgi:hypothetical protein